VPHWRGKVSLPKTQENTSDRASSPIPEGNFNDEYAAATRPLTPEPGEAASEILARRYAVSVHNYSTAIFSVLKV
jgi:hypothetical protein